MFTALVSGERRTDVSLDLRNFCDAKLACSVWKKLCDVMSSLVSSTPCTGLAASVAQWNKRSRGEWQQCQHSTCPRFSSTTKTLQTRSEESNLAQDRRSSRQRICTQVIDCREAASALSQAWTHRCAVDRTRSKGPLQNLRLEEDRCRPHRLERHPCHHLPTPTGISPRLLPSVDRQARLTSNLHPQILVAEQTVLSVQPMSWKCLTALHGVRVFEEALRHDGPDSDGSACTG